MGDRVVPFRPRAQPVAGSVSFPNDALRLPFGKSHYDPQWGFSARARIDGEEAPVPVEAGLVAEIADEPDSLGWLDRGEDGFSGKFVIGHDWEAIIRQAAFSPVPWEIQLSFSTDGEGEVVRLSLGMFRRQADA